MAIGRRWNGRVYGTNTGNVSVILDGPDDNLAGIIRLADDQAGLAVYAMAGAYAEGALTLVGNFEGEVPDGLIVGELTVDGNITADGRLVGEWSTTIGSGGTFQLHPHDYEPLQAAPGAIPEQLNVSIKTLGAMRLYAADIRSLIKHLTKDFSNKRAIVTYNDAGNEKNIFSDDFEAVLDNLPKLTYLKISIQEPELYNLNRNAVIELSAWGDNTIRVQSVQESWAIGKAEALSRQMQGHHRSIATPLRKFGLSVNLLILIAVLAALPGLPTFGQRLLFTGGAFGVQLLIAFLHRRYVPNFIFYPSQAESSLVGKFWPGLASWGITIAGGVASTVIYGLLEGKMSLGPIVKWITTIIE